MRPQDFLGRNNSIPLTDIPLTIDCVYRRNQTGIPGKGINGNGIRKNRKLFIPVPNIPLPPGSSGE
jgi:hypothetical protein